MIRSKPPPQALLCRYDRPGNHTDCYFVDLIRTASFADYVEAFYCSTAFRPERALLGLMGMRSGDEDARRLARGEAEGFSAWTVEARTENQLLLCDYKQATRSWLMLIPAEYGAALFRQRGGAHRPLGRAVADEPNHLPFAAVVPRLLLPRAAALGRTQPTKSP